MLTALAVLFITAWPVLARQPADSGRAVLCVLEGGQLHVHDAAAAQGVEGGQGGPTALLVHLRGYRVSTAVQDLRDAHAVSAKGWGMPPPLSGWWSAADVRCASAGRVPLHPRADALGQHGHHHKPPTAPHPPGRDGRRPRSVATGPPLVGTPVAARLAPRSRHDDQVCR